MDQRGTPAPHLEIVPAESLLPHEEHDSQRSEPLVERLRTEEFIINPPIVAPVNDHEYVILDGANRCHAFRVIGCPHMLVQIVHYHSGDVELYTWQHVVCAWNSESLLQHIAALPEIDIVTGYDTHAIAHILTRHHTYALLSSASNHQQRNALLREVVHIYQRNAVLHRTSLAAPEEVWPLYEDAVAVVIFPQYQPADIITAAIQQAYLPPGISRHIVHGRALRVNYPIARLRDEQTELATKNAELRQWVQHRYARRQVRFYAESTFQFDE